MKENRTIYLGLAWQKTAFIFLACFGFLFGNAIGQQLNFFRQFSHQHPVTQKTTDHDDFPSLCFRLDWNTLSNNWDSTFQYTTSYDANGLKADYTTSRFENGAFALYQKESFEYFLNGSLRKVTNAYRSANQWVNDTRRDYVYDANGNEILRTELTFNGLTWDSLSQLRHTITYNGSNGIIEDVEDTKAFLSSPMWQFIRKYEYALDNNNEWDTLIFSQWTGAMWEPVVRVLDMDFYDFSRELPLYATLQNYDNGTWKDTQRYNVTYSQYDSQDWIIEEYQSSWDTTMRELVIFDAQEHEVQRDILLWSGNSWNLNTSNVYDYTYDLDDRTTERVRRTWNGTSYINNIKKVIPSFFVVGAADPVKATHLKTWPNPAQTYFNLDLSDLQGGPILLNIYDETGKLRLTSSLLSIGEIASIEIPTHFENGMFVWKLKHKSGSSTGKLLIQR